MRVLLFSTLYPSSVKPGHGIFVETRLRELLKSAAVEARVVAPVPWFPSTHPRFGEYAGMAAVPRRETRHGIEVLHPRYPLLPKVGMSTAPFLLASAMLPTLRRLMREGFDFDLIDAHYFYPDGVAAALLSRWLGKPLTITARGSDLNLIGQYAWPRRLMRWAAGQAGGSIGVSSALVDVLRGWGVDEERLHVMRNGVDLQRFSPHPRDAARHALELDGAPLLLSVGNLVPLKGHDLTMRALQLLLPEHPGARLVIVGEGPELERLQALARELGLADKVRFAGRLDNASLAAWFSAADMLVLASSREGWANVLLEAMACGTPVVATAVGGSPEVVADAAAGVLVRERSAEGIAQAVRELIHHPRPRAEVRHYAEGFSWEATTQAQLDLFRRLCAVPGTKRRVINLSQ
ncbi:glycosyltransferase family 4 protein [Azohydromonas caseinilytica]|uniref:Glycosyltransferase family 4 protein n=1 Tax=Azohydromonas caseinilytica TaxID=2728836 RepID=A0A848F2X4_9BURK|nr:glycosyltransferase family 4 protein [Azohydromonas caseinilytica]